ncbi:IS630 family transposase [Roseisolibacter agri]|uniref:IS630 family transposase n=1 Tax=Roseisolibacter agri TaxID=2014610 RepID=A0AA37QG00_9BACT|nr:IS630 family transposase [Roseisolibacter agri]GLC28206.1 IS630 family transposase [Roseisolibacter agri]
MPAPYAVPITVSEADRLTLQSWARRPKTAQALALRARIVLAAAADDGASNGEIAARLGTHRHTVAKWRQRYATRGLAGLTDEPRPGAPRTITDDRVDQALAATLEQAPPNGTHWSTRQLARRVGLSQTAVSRIWRAFGLQPHRTETFKLSRDPQFVEKVRDVVGLYLAPPDRALVLCVDEKTQVQAREPTVPVMPMRSAQLERRTHDYVRHGTTDLFAALDVHLVLDNAATHKTEIIRRWLRKRPRYHVHFTPTSASWLNLVECWFSILQRRELARGVYRSTYALERAIRQYVAVANTEARPFVWTKTADEILASVARFCLRTSDSGY